MSRSPVLRSPVIILATLAALAACNKEPPPDPNQVLPVGAPALDVSKHPQVIFQIFGDRGDPKMMPIATVTDGAIRPIGLSRSGWRAFDSAYFAAGAKYSIYVDDEAKGTVSVTRGMWTGGDEPLYPLPGCRDLRPLASVSLETQQKASEPTVEFLAAAEPLKPHPPSAPSQLTPDAASKLGRTLAKALGARSSMDDAELDSLDFVSRLFVTGATKQPTLLASFIDPQAGDLGPGKGHTSHILALFDKVDTGYIATYRHVASGDAKTVEFQRVVDHMDVDGDGVDELILEAWHYAGTSDLVVLKFLQGQWHEALRASSRWCLDPPKPGEAKKP